MTTGVDDAALHALFDGVADAVIVLDVDARVCFCNRSTSTLLGVSADLANGHPISTLPPGLPASDSYADGGRHQLLLRREGVEPRRLNVSVSPVAMAGQPWRTLLFVRHVEHELGSMVRGPVLYDDVTPLPGRALFTDRVQQATGSLARRRSRAAVLLLDIGRFMEINAALGHARGDDVLRAAVSPCPPRRRTRSSASADCRLRRGCARARLGPTTAWSSPMSSASR